MADKKEALFELYRRNKLTGPQKAAVEELALRSGVDLLPIKRDPDALIKQAQREQSLQELAQEQSGLDAFAIGAGQGLRQVAAGAGFAEPESGIELEAMQALEQERPVSTTAGNIVGQALPFVAATGPLGMIRNQGVRVGASAGVGAGEGALIAEGTGNEDVAEAAGIGGTIAGGAEAISPALGRGIRAVYSRLTGKPPTGALIDKDGMPTPELAQALARENMNWQDLKESARDIIARQQIGSSPAEVVRMARFEELGVTPTRGQVSQEFDQLKQEQALLQSGTEAVGREIRQNALQQSQAIEGYVRNIIDQSGVDPTLGESLKDALRGRKETLLSERRDLYRQLAEQSESVGMVPISNAPLLQSLPDARTMRQIQRKYPADMENFAELLAEFGVDTSEDAVEMLGKKGIQVSPLGVHNQEEFRQALRTVIDSEPNMARIVRPVIDALDNEFEAVTQGLEAGGGQLGRLAKDARRSHIALREEFDPKSMTSKLIDFQKGSGIPIIESSRAFSKLMAQSTPNEQVSRVVESLTKAGKEGQTAIKHMQGQAVLDIMDSAFSALGRKVDGEQTMGFNAFIRDFEKNKEKLQILFQNSPAELRKLETAVAGMRDLIPPNATVPKGSAGFIMDFLDSSGLYSPLTKLPGVGPGMAIYREYAKRNMDEQFLRRAIKFQPKVRDYFYSIEKDYPRLAATMGIVGISQAGGQNDDNQQ